MVAVVGRRLLNVIKEMLPGWYEKSHPAPPLTRWIPDKVFRLSGIGRNGVLRGSQQRRPPTVMASSGHLAEEPGLFGHTRSKLVFSKGGRKEGFFFEFCGKK